jgi:hypothetical protein
MTVLHVLIDLPGKIRLRADLFDQGCLAIGVLFPRDPVFRLSPSLHGRRRNWISVEHEMDASLVRDRSCLVGFFRADLIGGCGAASERAANRLRASATIFDCFSRK